MLKTKKLTKSVLPDNIQAQAGVFAQATKHTPTLELTTIPKQEISKAESAALNTLANAKSIVVNSPITRQEAVNYISKTIKPAKSFIKSLLQPNIDRIKRLLDESKQDLNKVINPLTSAELIIKDTITSYDDEVERIQRLEHERIAESQRLESERLALEEASNLLQSDNLDDQHSANQIIDSISNDTFAPDIQLPSMSIAIPKSEGSSRRILKRFEIINESKINRQFLTPDKVKIQMAIDKYGKEAESIVGEGSIRYKEVSSLAIREEK